MSDSRRLFVPLRSNAHGLLAGAPADRMRQRLKQASITFDQILLEHGAKAMTVGPHGGVELDVPVDELTTFQSPRARNLQPGQRFFLDLGNSSDSDSPEAMRRFIDSETSIYWSPTLQPFARELPPGADWIGYWAPRRPQQVKRTEDRWKARDRSNEVLRQRFPEQFVRSSVISHANRDLALAAHAGWAVMQDAMHRQVIDSRFPSNSGWKATGFALPLLVPDVGHLDWATIAQLRQHKSMKHFRRVVAEIETTALQESRGGDIESAVHHAAERYLAKAVGKIEGMGAIPRRGVMEFAIGSMTGVLTSGFVGPIGIVAGAGAGTAVAVAEMSASTVASRKRRAWVSVYNELHEST